MLFWRLQTSTAVSCLQILTALSDRSRGGEVSVLAVHVVGATAGVITQPDAKVLYLQWRLLMNLEIKRKVRSAFFGKAYFYTYDTFTYQKQLHNLNEKLVNVYTPESL